MPDELLTYARDLARKQAAYDRGLLALHYLSTQEAMTVMARFARRWIDTSPDDARVPELQAVIDRIERHLGGNDG
jgi:hypothetical protein